MQFNNIHKTRYIIEHKYKSAVSHQHRILSVTYADVLHPLVQDLVSFEKHGVYVEQLGECVKGTLLFVSADNLGSHSLAGFQESFTVEHPCRFCLAKKSDIQQKEVRSRAFEPRTSRDHDRQVSEVLEDPNLVKEYGVKGPCVKWFVRGCQS